VTQRQRYASAEDNVQRLFSTFPASWPGLGLLLLRLLAAVPLLTDSATILWTVPYSSASAIQFAILVVGALLTIGFCTPIAALLLAIIQIWMTPIGTHFVGVHVERALLGLSLIMLGPGAWSVDAWLFGRRRIDLDGD
jgi:putative oxidoreductase